MSKEFRKIWKSWSVGGDPDRIAFLSRDLRDKIQQIQTAKWEITSIDKTDIDRAWSTDRQKYISCIEYIIIGYFEIIE